MAKMKPRPTLTKPWRSVTDLRASFSRARELGEQHTRLIADMNGRVESRRKELDSTLSDLSTAQRMTLVGRAPRRAQGRTPARQPGFQIRAAARPRCAAPGRR